MSLIQTDVITPILKPRAGSEHQNALQSAMTASTSSSADSMENPFEEVWEYAGYKIYTRLRGGAKSKATTSGYDYTFAEALMGDVQYITCPSTRPLAEYSMHRLFQSCIKHIDDHKCACSLPHLAGRQSYTSTPVFSTPDGRRVVNEKWKPTGYHGGKRAPGRPREEQSCTDGSFGAEFWARVHDKICDAGCLGDRWSAKKAGLIYGPEATGLRRFFGDKQNSDETKDGAHLNVHNVGDKGKERARQDSAAVVERKERTEVGRGQVPVNCGLKAEPKVLSGVI